jgi:mycobactin lysine-N-oxygenase
VYSDPIHWAGLTPEEKRDAMNRTDRGVFSARVQDALLADDRIRHLRGRVAHAVARDERIRLTLQTERGGERLETGHGFDLVIDAPVPTPCGSCRCCARRPSTCWSSAWVVR